MLVAATGVGGVCHACSSYRSGWSLSCVQQLQEWAKSTVFLEVCLIFAYLDIHH